MRLGVLDIGSNTVHLLLVDAHPGARPVAYAEHKRSLPLIRYRTPTGRSRRRDSGSSWTSSVRPPRSRRSTGRRT